MNKFIKPGISMLMLLILFSCNIGNEAAPPSPPAEYEVRFFTNDGSEVYESMTAISPDYQLSLLPAEPAKEGYLFRGWFTGINGTGEGFTLQSKVESDLDLFAFWDSYSYSLNYNSQESTSAAPASVTVESPAVNAETLPAAPVKTGYSFGGWYSLPEGQGEQFTEITPITENTTVYAYWADYAFNITYNSQGADTQAAPTTKIVASPKRSIESFPSPPQKRGYLFGGWYTQPDGQGTEITETSDITDDITLYAKWNSTTFLVTYDSQEAETLADPVTQQVSSPSITTGSLPVAPQKRGYIFNGWYTQPEGEGERFTGATEITDSLTVYADWSEYSYTVSFNSQVADTPASPVEKTINSPVTSLETLPRAPEKTGFLFGGWFTEPNGAGIEITESSFITGDSTLYALWNNYSYDISFNSQGAHSEAEPQVLQIASPATATGGLPTAPEKLGYFFGGWYSHPNGEGEEFTEVSSVSGSKTVYAYWTDYAHRVNFNSQGANTPAAPAEKLVASPATSLAVFPNEPEKSGYFFGGWFSAPFGAGTKYNESTPIGDDLTLYAFWDSYHYNLSYNSQGADREALPMVQSVSSPALNVGALPQPPEKDHYLFGGWFTQPNGQGIRFTEVTPIEGDMVLYANWENYNYTLTYNSQAAETAAVPTTQTVTSPAFSAGTLPAEPIKPGYNFGGWFTETNGAGSQFSESTPVRTSQTLYAFWESYSHRVIFDNRGADQSTPAVTVSSPASTLASLPETPVKEGYIFGGWFTALNGGGDRILEDTPITADTTLYANWVLYQHSVSFDSEDADTDATPSVLYVDSPETTLGTFPAEPVKNGYIFDGWFTGRNGTGVEYNANSNIDSDITLYANWRVYGYLVSFDSQNADSTALPQSKNISSPQTTVGSLPSEPEKTGYLFAGWFTEPNGSGSQISETTEVTSDLDVYAFWDSYSYNLTFDSQSADTAATPTILQVNSPALTPGSLPAEPEKTGYLFGGWFTSTSGNGEEITGSSIITSDKTIYAYWQSYSYEVSFDSRNAQTPASPENKTVSSPSTTLGTLPDDPEKQGYTFKGWFTQAEGGGTEYNADSPLNGDITLYAFWQSNTTILAEIDIPSSDQITVSGSESTLVKGESISINVVQSDYQRYQWFLDSAEENMNTSSITIDTSNLSAGVHTVMLKVTDSYGISTSAFCRFTVTN